MQPNTAPTRTVFRYALMLAAAMQYGGIQSAHAYDITIKEGETDSSFGEINSLTIEAGGALTGGGNFLMILD